MVEKFLSVTSLQRKSAVIALAVQHYFEPLDLPSSGMREHMDEG